LVGWTQLPQSATFRLCLGFGLVTFRGCTIYPKLGDATLVVFDGLQTNLSGFNKLLG